MKREEFEKIYCDHCSSGKCGGSQDLHAAIFCPHYGKLCINEPTKYIIDEDNLKDILYKASVYEALEQGGVNNWEWCSESITEMLNTLGYETVEEMVDEELMPQFKKLN